MSPSDENILELRVLVVDDNVDVATSLSYLLQMLDCKSAVAYDRATALRVADIFRPHIVFLDLELPDDDGCAVLAAMNLQCEGAHRPLSVCVTGSTDPCAHNRCIEAGFDLFIVKPMPLEALTHILNECRESESLAVQSTVAPEH